MKKYKNKIIFSAIAFLILVCLTFCCCYIADSGEPHNCYEEAFGKETYAELKKGCSIKDKKTLEPIMKEIEQALNFIGTKKEAKEKFGKLSYYCRGNKNTVLIESEVKFLTAKLYNDTGYMWIEYTQIGYNKKGKTTCGSAYTNSRITLVKFNDGKWKAVNIKEAP